MRFLFLLLSVPVTNATICYLLATAYASAVVSVAAPLDLDFPTAEASAAAGT